MATKKSYLDKVKQLYTQTINNVNELTKDKKSITSQEVVKKRMKQEEFAREITNYKNVEIICDSARPDLIRDYSDYGFDVIGATKRWKGGGRNSVWEWLRQREKIVIDPERTPHAHKEFTRCEFEKLKDGTFSSAYPTLDEDCIMSCGYAMNRVIIDDKDEI